MWAEIIAVVCILFFAIVLHEFAHGWVAYKCGDDTARLAGRLTLNPLKHVDPVGTLLLPGILLTLRAMGVNIFIFGWAKPVPVNFYRLRNPKRDMIWVGMAGPTINVVLAILFSKLLISDFSSGAMAEWLLIAIFINLLLAVFNMMPIPPLDGSRLVMGLLPQRYVVSYARLERYGILLVILAISVLDVFDRFILPIVEFCGNLLGVRFIGVII